MKKQKGGEGVLILPDSLRGLRRINIIFAKVLLI
jgi:hypothetical protein